MRAETLFMLAVGASEKAYATAARLQTLGFDPVVIAADILHAQ